MRPRSSHLTHPTPNAPFFFRSLVPKDLQPVLGKKAFLISLQCVKLRPAKKRAKVLKRRADQIYEQIRMGKLKNLTIEDVKAMLKAQLERLQKDARDFWELDPRLFEPGVKEVATKAEDEVLEFLKRVGAMGNYDRAAQSWLKAGGFKVDMESELYKVLRKNLVLLEEAITEYRKKVIQGQAPQDWNLVGDLLEDQISSIGQQPAPTPATPAAQAQPAPPAAPAKTGPKTPMSQIAEAFRSEKRDSGEITDKTHNEYTASLDLLLELIYSPYIEDFDYAAAREVKASLQKYPKNRRKMAAYQGLTLAAITKRKDYEPISTKTVNNHLRRFSAFLNWAVRHGYCEKNYFEGLQIKQKKKLGSTRERFSAEQVKTIFEPTAYKTAAAKRKNPDACYWVPLMGLYTGARLNEICQLHLENLHQGDTPYIEITDTGDDQRLKNESSRRKVPIHQDLIDLGLLDYADRMAKAGHERLFPELSMDRDGYGKYVSRWFNETYLPKIAKVKTANNNFHSLRHTVADHLKQQGIRKEFIAEFLGHSTESITLEVYGKRLAVEVLKDEIADKMDFGLEIEKLKR